MYKIIPSTQFLLPSIACCFFILQGCGRDVPRVDAPQSNPEIISISPANGEVQITDTINGSGFSGEIKNDSVYFNGVRAKVLFASATQLIAEVPLLATTGNVTVSVNGVQAKGPIFTVVDAPVFVPPSITSIRPSHGVANTRDTILGSGFDTIAARNIVYFNAATATVLSAMPDRLIVRVPVSVSGNVAVSVNGNFTNGPVFTYDVVPPDTVPQSQSDTLAFITQKWSAFQDTVSSINYGNSSGAPISGVLYNPATDYWNFLLNGNLNIVLQGTYYTTTYQIQPENKILITGLPAGLTKPSTIITLTSHTFIFVTTDTIPGIGTYYRRVWLRK